MITPADVRAQVVDVSRPSGATPAKVVVDANALYFASYVNFPNLRAVGGRVPHAYQLRDYPIWLNRLDAHGGEALVAMITLAEAVHPS